jgi:cell division transport system ATP-binding protein
MSETVIAFQNAQIFQKDHLVLSEVNLEVKKGEFVYLIGRTGTGKSSLLKTIYGDLPLTEGTGMVAGFDLTKLKRSKVPHLRRKLGIVFQDFQLLSDRSIHANLLFVMKATGWKDKKKMEENIEKTLGSVGLAKLGYKFPHQLSGGEQQRVAIARALINDPELILADEPTGNLDPETSNEIMRLLFEISGRGRAIVMATHDYSLLQHFSSRTIRCEEERILEVSSAALGL